MKKVFLSLMLLLLSPMSYAACSSVDADLNGNWRFIFPTSTVNGIGNYAIVNVLNSAVSFVADGYKRYTVNASDVVSAVDVDDVTGGTLTITPTCQVSGVIRFSGSDDMTIAVAFMTSPNKSMITGILQRDEGSTFLFPVPFTAIKR